jgi:hypothetical protein
MKDDQIDFRILLRSPKYPAIVIAEDDIWPAFDIEELGTICVISEPEDGSTNMKVIDNTGEEFWYLPNQYALAPGFPTKKWTKKKIIDLYNNSEASKESGIEYSSKSLSSRRLSKIIREICDILRHNQRLHEDRS